MQKTVLDSQAVLIETVLASHKVPSYVRGGAMMPRSVRFFLTPAIGAKLSRIKSLSEEIALALGTTSCRIFRHKGTIAIDVPRPNPASVGLLPLCHQLDRIPPFCAVLGVDGQGTPTLVRLPSPEVAHILIAGTTGSGKTALARTIIASLAIHNRLGQVQVVLIDPKRKGFRHFSQLPHLLHPVVSDLADIQEIVFALLREMERRDAEEIDTPRIVVFLDELADLLLTGGRQMEHALTRLSQRGRGAGLHLVACTQKPTAAAVGSLIKSNFPVRIVGKVTSPEDARVATGLPGTGAEKLQGRGDFLLVACGQTTRLQAAYISDAEIREVVERLRARGRTRRRWSSVADDGPTDVPERAAKWLLPSRRVTRDSPETGCLARARSSDHA